MINHYSQIVTTVSIAITNTKISFAGTNLRSLFVFIFGEITLRDINIILLQQGMDLSIPQTERINAFPTIPFVEF